MGKTSFSLDNKPLPLYSRLPNKFKGLSIGQLFVDDRTSLYLVGELPKSLNCQELVAPSFSRQPIALLKGSFFGFCLFPTRPGVDQLTYEAAKAVAANAKVTSATPSSTSGPKEATSERRPTRLPPTDSAAAKRKATPSAEETA
ncbi:hypothetical protein CR513_42653, partial [Mucuna pruriens]